MTMKHDYAREKLTLLLRDLDSYNGDEFWRQMSRIANGATHHPSAEGLQEALKLSVTCLGELYNALGVGDTNETFQHCEALKAIATLKAKNPSTTLALRDLMQQQIGINQAVDHILSIGSKTHKAFIAHDRHMYISTRALKTYAQALANQQETTPCPPR